MLGIVSRLDETIGNNELPGLEKNFTEPTEMSICGRSKCSVLNVSLRFHAFIDIKGWTGRDDI